MNAWRQAGAGFLIAAAAAMPVRAQESGDDARKLFQRGEEQLAQGLPDYALASFEEAFEASKAPSLLFYIGEANRAGGHWKEAEAAYKGYLAQLPAGPRAKEARERLADVRAAARSHRVVAAPARPPPAATAPRKVLVLPEAVTLNSPPPAESAAEPEKPAPAAVPSMVSPLAPPPAPEPDAPVSLVRGKARGPAEPSAAEPPVAQPARAPASAAAAAAAVPSAPAAVRVPAGPLLPEQPSPEPSPASAAAAAGPSAAPEAVRVPAGPLLPELPSPEPGPASAAAAAGPAPVLETRAPPPELASPPVLETRPPPPAPRAAPAAAVPARSQAVADRRGRQLRLGAAGLVLGAAGGAFWLDYRHTAAAQPAASSTHDARLSRTSAIVCWSVGGLLLAGALIDLIR